VRRGSLFARSRPESETSTPSSAFWERWAASPPADVRASNSWAATGRWFGQHGRAELDHTYQYHAQLRRRLPRHHRRPPTRRPHPGTAPRHHCQPRRATVDRRWPHGAEAIRRGRIDCVALPTGCFPWVELCARNFRITTDRFGCICDRRAGTFRVARLRDGMIYACVSERSEI
jgi:hypothetical protein